LRKQAERYRDKVSSATGKATGQGGADGKAEPDA
jgi:hypothetical protein